MSFNYRYLLYISGLDDTEKLEIYKTYMHFGQISDNGKVHEPGDSPNLGQI
jgi:hypothetical protein